MACEISTLGYSCLIDEQLLDFGGVHASFATCLSLRISFFAPSHRFVHLDPSRCIKQTYSRADQEQWLQCYVISIHKYIVTNAWWTKAITTYSLGTSGISTLQEKSLWFLQLWSTCIMKESSLTLPCPHLGQSFLLHAANLQATQ